MKLFQSCALAAFLLLFAAPTFAQQEITLEDLWGAYKFYPKSVSGFNFMNDGTSYIVNNKGTLQASDITTGEEVGEAIFEAEKFKSSKTGFPGKFGSYKMSDDERYITFKCDSERIYRRSSKANFFIFDRETQKMTPVSRGGKQMYSTMSPDRKKVAFVRENNIYITDLATGKEEQITSDGKMNEIINGSADWVYEEEFSMSKAFYWSPDSKYIAYLRFDEREVPEFIMPMYTNDLHPEYSKFKYPKAGQTNSRVSAHMYDLSSKTMRDVQLPRAQDRYIPRLRWTSQAHSLCVVIMNRHQSMIELLLADARTGETKPLYSEKDEKYIEEAQLDRFRFLDDGKHFLWSSEKSGYNHVYLMNMSGKQVAQLTKGNYDVTSIYGVDEKNGIFYYQSAEVSPLERHVYCVNLKGKKKKQLTKEKGWHSAEWSSTYDYFVHRFSTANSPGVTTVRDRSGKQIRAIQNNDELAAKIKTYNAQPVEFFTFKTDDGTELNGWMIKPAGIKTGDNAPVFMTCYGGPGSQEVTDRWDAFNYWWFQMLVQQGFVVASIDNRGTGARGADFKKVTYLELGKYEAIDQIEGAKYLGGLDFTDKSRIGIFGWSYGGYLSSLALLKGSDIFKAAIAVAPVTNWKWYDTIYTERYMRTPQENPDGYEKNSPVNFAADLKGDYLLVHGSSDDNVHMQNSMEMANALINANKQFETYIYPNRNHGIYGGYTRLHLYTKMTDFLMRSLGDKLDK